VIKTGLGKFSLTFFPFCDMIFIVNKAPMYSVFFYGCISALAGFFLFLGGFL